MMNDSTPEVPDAVAQADAANSLPEVKKPAAKPEAQVLKKVHGP